MCDHPCNRSVAPHCVPYGSTGSRAACLAPLAASLSGVFQSNSVRESLAIGRDSRASICNHCANTGTWRRCSIGDNNRSANVTNRVTFGRAFASQCDQNCQSSSGAAAERAQWPRLASMARPPSALLAAREARAVASMARHAWPTLSARNAARLAYSERHARRGENYR
jgi:hypothetical protein